MSFGERLRAVRTEQGLTAKDLSEASGVPEKSIYRIETGEVGDPRMSTVIPLIRSLNCSADELIFDKKDFTKLGELRQLFLQFAEIEPQQQQLMLDVIQKLNLAFGFEAMMEKALQDKVSQGKAITGAHTIEVGMVGPATGNAEDYK
jgi:transcriptional regulator with XRE-family HTH domain